MLDSKITKLFNFMKKVMKLIITIVILSILVAVFYYVSKTISAVTGKTISGWVSKALNN